MIWLNNVKVENNGRYTKVFLNDVELRTVHSIDFEQTVGELPQFTFDVYGFPRIVIENADIVFKYHPETVRESIVILNDSLQKDMDLYDAFRCSILSAIAESPDNCMSGELASRILDRIIGKG